MAHGSGAPSHSYLSSKSSSGYLGVRCHKGRYQAQAWISGTDHYIGAYDTAVGFGKWRIAFIRGAYEGISGSHAWACEGVSDLLMKLAKDKGKAMLRGIGLQKLKLHRDLGLGFLFVGSTVYGFEI